MTCLQREPQLRNCFYLIGLGACLWGSFYLLIGVGGAQTPVGSPTPEQVMLGCLRKVVEYPEKAVSKQCFLVGLASSVPAFRFLFEFLPRFPVMNCIV